MYCHMPESIFIDSETGLFNYIKFATQDLAEVFIGTGDCVVIEAEKEKMSKHESDFDLKLLGHVIKETSPEILKYRIEDNVFLAILPESEGSACKFAMQLCENLESFGIKPLSKDSCINLAIHSYQNLRSLSDFYFWMREAYRKNHLIFNENEWIKYILDNVTDKLKSSVAHYHAVREYALYDEISNLPNAKSAKLYVEDLKKNRINLAFLFIDGDNLSQFNKISYEEGNRAIRALADMISQSIRSQDQIFRWLSGDEFLVIAEFEKNDEILNFAERIRSSVEEKGRKLKFPTTVSVGVSVMDMKNRSPYEIIKKAELASRKAKDKGKNQVVFWSE